MRCVNRMKKDELEGWSEVETDQTIERKKPTMHLHTRILISVLAIYRARINAISLCEYGVNASNKHRVIFS